jgi:hypothetical protein
MKKLIGLSILGLLAIACSSNPNKAEKIKTDMDKKEEISGDTTLGVKDGQMVVQKKVMMNEELRKLQIEVYSLEDKVYGNRNYGSLGLYGVLRQCRMDLADKKNGGDGKLIWTEPMERVTANEDDYKIGVDEKDKLVGVNEEFLKDRITRFRGYRNVLEKRNDEYEEKLAICQADLKSRKHDVEAAAAAAAKAEASAGKSN